MKENIPEWIYNTGLMTIGYYCRVIFGGDKFSWKQLVCLYAFGLGLALIVNEISIQTIYKLCIMLVAGIVLPNLIKIIIKSANKSEDKASDNISDKVDKYTK